MDTEQIILKVRTNNQPIDEDRLDIISVDEAVKIFAALCKGVPEAIPEKIFSFNPIKQLFMKKNVYQILDNYVSKPGVTEPIMLSAFRSEEGCSVRICTGKGKFYNKLSVGEMFNIEEKDIEVLDNAGKYGYENNKKALVKPSYIEYDEEEDPNYILLDYAYAPSLQYKYSPFKSPEHYDDSLSLTESFCY